MPKLISPKLALVLIGVLAICACSAPVAVGLEREEIMSTNSNCDFEKVPEHAAMQDPCSPEIDEFDFDWRGLKINMPEKVSLPGDAEPVLRAEQMRMPVFIVLQLTLDRLAKYEFEREGVNLIFVDQQTGKSYTGNLMESNPTLPMEKHKFSQQEMEASVMRYFYNINALEFIELPNSKTSYDVYASFEEFKSNVMTVTTR